MWISDLFLAEIAHKELEQQKTAAEKKASDGRSSAVRSFTLLVFILKFLLNFLKCIMYFNMSENSSRRW